MKMHFTKAFSVCCTLALFFLTYGNANAQCLVADFGQWPSGAFTPTCDGSAQTITSAAFTDEFSIVNVEAGEEYIFSSNVSTHYLTISADGGATAAAFGTTPVSWTSTVTGPVRFYSHLSDSCDGTNVGTVSRLVQCGEVDCPALEANIGDPCDDGNPNTGGSTVDEFCDCTGGVATAGNQTCETAEPISCGASVSGSTIAASVDAVPFCGTGDGSGGGVWYSFFANVSGIATFDLCNTDYDSKIRIYEGSCGAFTCLAGNDDNSDACGPGNASFVEADVAIGETYYVLVHGFSGNEGTFTLNVTCAAYECPALEANIGDACDDENAGTFDDTVDATCACVGTPYDCPALEANIGDACDDLDENTINDLVTASCACEGTPAPTGSQCTDPIVVASLPYTDSGNTATFGDLSATMPTSTTFPDASNGTGSASYISGPEAVYQYTVAADGELEITVDGIISGDWVGLMAFKECPFTERLAYSTSTIGTERIITPLPVVAGEVIYIVVSTWESETSSTDYNLTIEEFAFDCPVLEVDFGTPCDDLDSSTFDDVIDENCECNGTPFDCPVLEANIGDPCDDGDLFTINTTLDASCDCTGGTAVPVGGACFNPTFISTLPYSTIDSTSNYLDVYSSEDRPVLPALFEDLSTGTGSEFFLNGDDAVYSYIPPSTGAVDITLSDHGTWAGLWVMTGCPEFDQVVAYHTDSGSSGRSIEGLPVQGGQLYYIVVSTFPAPQSINYTLTVEEAEFDCPTLEANIGNACDDLDPTTFDDVVTEACECVGTPYDCPAELANIGDLCDADGAQGRLDSLCACEEVIFNGCTNGFAFGTIDAACDSTETASGSVVGCFVQEYTDILNVGNGQEFTFSVTDHDGDIQLFFVTITDASGTNVLASGIAPFDWTSTVAGDLRYYTHGSETCFGTITGAPSVHTRAAEWDCSSVVFDCPVLEANIGDTCDDEDSTTFDDVINENCECEGTPFDCPVLEANFGDSCDDVEFGLITEDCECVTATFEGCTVENFGLFGEFETVCNDSVTGGSFTQNFAWVQEYSEIVVGTDVEYTFYTTGLPATLPIAYLTLTDTDNNIIEFGTDTLVWTAPASLDGDTIRYWVHGAPDCISLTTGSASSHTKNIDYVCPPAGCTADGGTLTANSPRSICVGTGSSQGISIDVTGASGTFQRWGLLDSDGNILDTRLSNSLFNLDGYAPGDYSIRYIRYEADVSLSGLTNASQLANLEGCWDASNAINIFLRPEPNGGTLTALSPTTVCEAGGSSTGIAVELTGATGENSRFGLVNVSAPGNPIVATQNGTTFNLNPYPVGTYQVRHLAYQEGVVLSSSIQFQSELEGCFAISNGVTVSIVDCASAQLQSSPNPTAGPSFVTFTNPREENATLEVYDMSGRLVSTIFRQVTTPDQEYRVEFDGAGLPNGVYLYRLTTPTEVIVDKFMIAK